jgi:FkbM family methyltransferase
VKKILFKILTIFIQKRIFRYKIHSLLKRIKGLNLLYSETLNGIKFELDIKEEVDFSIYLGNHDFLEVEYFLQNLGNESTFLDIGANIGYYSLLINHKYPQCRILAVEADDYNYNRLLLHARMNNANIECFNMAINDRSGKVLFQANDLGNRGASAISTDVKKSMLIKEIDCLTLADFIKINNVKKISGIKIDIEGFEYPVLKHFFENSDKNVWPEFIITEAFGYSILKVNGSPIEEIIKHGYHLVNHTLFNFFFHK